MREHSYLIDTNVVLDLLLAREPFKVEATHIFALAEAQVIRLFLSSDAISTIAYLVGKNASRSKARQALAILLDYITLVPLDEALVMKALALDFSDIEDALVAASADESGARAIITRNAKDFANSPVPAVSPPEFLAYWAKESSKKE